MDKTTILEQLFEKDFVTKEVELIPNKLSIKIRNLDFESQAALEDVMKNLGTDLTNRQFLQNYSLQLLAYTLISWGKYSTQYPDEWVSFLAKKSTALLHKAVDEQQKLEKEIKEAINLEDITKTFSQEGKLADDSMPSLGESMSAQKGA